MKRRPLLFFTLSYFGPSMFFVAAALHLANIVLVCRRELRWHLMPRGSTCPDGPLAAA